MKEERGDKNNGIYSGIKKKEILSFATTRMKLKGITLSEIKSDGERQTLDYLICAVLKINQRQSNS